MATGAVVSGSMAQPLTVTWPGPVANPSRLPKGEPTCTVRQPIAGLLLPTGPVLMPYTQTLWTPGAADTVMSKPWLGPIPGTAAATSGRDPRRWPARPSVPST